MVGENELKKDITRVAIYVRVSTEEQAMGGSSLEEQEHRIRAYCESKGWEVYRVYKDTESGRSRHRAKLMELLRDAKPGLFDIVIVYKLDRMSRSVKNMIDIIDTLEGYGVKFCSLTEAFDTSHSTGRLLFNMLSSIAEFESDTIGERAYMGMLSKSRDCNYNGGTVPDGYEIEGGKWKVDRDRRPIIKLIFDLYYHGEPDTKQEMGCSAIAKWLNEKNYRTKRHITKTGKVLGGKAWDGSAIRRILTNPIYYGTYTWNKYRIRRMDGKTVCRKRPKEEWIIREGAIEPIISKDVFIAVQKKLQSNSKVLTRTSQEDYLFNGLLYFAPCRIRLVGWKKQRGERVDRYYRCNPATWKRIKKLGKGQELTPYCKNCRIKSVRKDVIEPFLIEKIKGLKSELPKIRELTDKIQKRATSDVSSLEQRESRIHIEKGIVEGEMKRLYEKLKNGKITKQVFSKEMDRIARRDKDLDREIFQIETKKNESAIADQDARLAEDMIAQFPYYFQRSPEKEKKSLVQAIVKRVDIEHNGKVHITFRLPLRTGKGEEAKVVLPCGAA